MGEDGATHQPVEHLAALRATPDMRVFRPCDSRETTAAWISALTTQGPTCLVLTRQNLPQYEGTGKQALKGGYVLSQSSDKAQAIVMATGSEVSLAMEAQEMLANQGIGVQVVSMPSMELFMQQPAAYQQEVLPASLRDRVAIEAGATMPWYRFVGLDGQVIGLDQYGASAPQEVLFKAYGITAEAVVEAVQAHLKK